MSKLTGGEGGDDIFVFLAIPRAAAHRVRDFSVKDDVVALDPSQFDDVPVGHLPDTYFHVGKAAKTADHHVLYNRQTGALSWMRMGRARRHRSRSAFSLTTSR